jgi:hypothetical protein
LFCTVVTVAFILPAGYRHEAIQLCNIAIVDRTRCETDMDGLHAQIGESYRSLRDLERVLNRLPPAAQSSRDSIRHIAISMSGWCNMDPAAAIESADCSNTMRLLSHRQ